MSENNPFCSEIVAKAVHDAFITAVGAVDPFDLVKDRVSLKKNKLTICEQEIDLNTLGRIVVIGAGKASARMALGFEAAISACKGGEEVLEKVGGLVNVPDGSPTHTERIEINCARPQGVNAVTERVLVSTRRMLEMIGELGPEDVLIDLVSGGGSALREDLEGDLTIDQFLKAQRILQRTDIKGLNCVRKHCSKVKGGKLNAKTNAGLIIVMILSDVVDDSLDVISSGPWAENKTSPADALKILDEFEAKEQAPEVYSFLEKLSKKPFEPLVPESQVHQVIIGSNSTSLEAMAEDFRKRGYTVVNCASRHVGDAKHVGRTLGSLAFGMRISRSKLKVPMFFIFGGETTVNLKPGVGKQKGGRNQELVLAAMDAIWEVGMARTILFSLATDGEDGPTDAAGVIATTETLASAVQAGVTPTVFLDNNNSYPFWEAHGGLVKTGLTGTNVCDLWGFALLPEPGRVNNTVKLKK